MKHTPMTALERQGRKLIVHHYVGTRWTISLPGVPDSVVEGDWTIVKSRPRVGEVWARAAGERPAFRVHAVRYHLEAVHAPTLTQVQMTVWKCGARTFAPIDPCELEPAHLANLHCATCASAVKLQAQQIVEVELVEGEDVG